MTGFRVGAGQRAEVYAQLIPGFEPDMTVMGKVIGGGMPLAAFGGQARGDGAAGAAGRRVPGRHAEGNPVATACGLATLKEIQKPGFLKHCRPPRSRW
jgi:glutamate-1-semialdehyde 2,1-aminomutase